MLRLSYILLLAGLIACADAVAKRMYKFVDENGVTHYTDREPETDQPVDSWLVRAENTQLITLSQERLRTHSRVFATNYWHGPVEVGLVFSEQENISSTPSLPNSVVVANNGRSEVLVIRPRQADRGWRYELGYSAVPGDPSATPDNTVYRLPFRRGEKFYVGQGFGGLASHSHRQSYHAVDITMPEGTPVLAARGGVVMVAEEDFYGAGLDMKKYASRANNVRVLHDDGTMAIYAHLQLESVAVRAGKTIEAGELIGLSGNTGYSSGPHLHFALQVNVGLELATVPFVFATSDGNLRPQAGRWLEHP